MIWIHTALRMDAMSAPFFEKKGELCTYQMSIDQIIRAVRSTRDPHEVMATAIARPGNVIVA